MVIWFVAEDSSGGGLYRYLVCLHFSPYYNYPDNLANVDMQTDLKISPDAVTRVRQLLASKDNPDVMLRVYIQGGGCSGFQYGFQFDEDAQEDDISIEQDGIRILVDMLSLQYLGGAEIDYKDDIMGSRFLVKNPNASTTCGCGSSFSI